MAATDTHTTIEELLEEALCVRSVLGLCKEDELPLRESLQTAVTRVEFGVRWPPVFEDVRPGAEDPSLLNDVTSSAVKIVTENTSLSGIMICKV
jgi:hypothetical protein